MAQTPLSNQQPATSNTLWLCVLLLLAPIASANVTTAAIAGRVVIGGVPASGVTVTAESPALMHPRTTVTGPRGTYFLGALPPGEYELTFSLAGHSTMIHRAVAQLARVSRSDATLEVNADEDTVTSTATTPNATETTTITSHFDDATLDRLPLGRLGTPQVSPGIAFGTLFEVDGVAATSGLILAEDVVEQTTVVRGSAAVDYDTVGGNVIAVRTRQGGETFDFSLRDTLTNSGWIEDPTFLGEDEERPGLQHLLESTVGGRILPQRLWFLAAAWGGERAGTLGDLRAFHAKLQAQAGASQHIDVSFTEGRKTFMGSSAPMDRSFWLHHTAVAGPRFTWDTQWARTNSSLGSPVAHFQTTRPPRDSLHSRASYLIPVRGGDHLLTAGVATKEESPFERRSLFVSDRWSSSRWVVNVGLRSDEVEGDETLTPRVAVTFDVDGNGRNALTASHGEYTLGDNPSTGPAHLSIMRVTTLGYATALGSSGSARVDLFRRENSGITTDALELDARYRLFDRFEAGGTYTYSRVEEELQFIYPEHRAHGWLAMELPLGEHELGVTFLQRYVSAVASFSGDLYPTDLAVRYTMPVSRVRLTFAGEATNVFSQGEYPTSFARALRFWVRVRG